MADFCCRICSAKAYQEILSFGEVALSDSFLADSAAFELEKKYPLTLIICENCHHVQIKEILDPDLLFKEYPWETGIPSSIHPYCKDFANAMEERMGRQGFKRVLEIASNDGTMLREFKQRGYDVLGVDPAQNIARKANAGGIPTIAKYFHAETADAILQSNGRFDLIIARNVMAHVADLQGLVSGINTLLSPEGMAVIEVPQLLTLYEELQYDQVFHEHIGYHSLDSVQRAFQMVGLKVIDAEETWIHGGSLRISLCHESRSDVVSSARVQDLLARETEAGILNPEAWASFGDRARQQKEQLNQILQDFAANGKKIAGYGASGKGQTMLQFCKLDTNLISFIADKSPSKIGKFTPGSHIPVVSPEQMREEDIDVLVLFAWNFAEEILQQESALHERGVKFVHPLPVPRIIGD